jgi:hypothetical protein
MAGWKVLCAVPESEYNQAIYNKMVILKVLNYYYTF